jgi:hypothetical protein
MNRFQCEDKYLGKSSFDKGIGKLYKSIQDFMALSPRWTPPRSLDFPKGRLIIEISNLVEGDPCAGVAAGCEPPRETSGMSDHAGVSFFCRTRGMKFAFSFRQDT